MASPSAEIVNQALWLAGGNQPLVTGAAPTFDSSTAGVAAAQLYAPCIRTVLRSFQWDSARRTEALVLSGNVAPFPWALEYLYPPDAVQIWTLMPSVQADPFDPLPINFNVANAVVSGSQERVIHADLAGALTVYNNTPLESNWDSGLREAVVRLLASELAMAIGGKPDTAMAYLQSAGAAEQSAEQRRD